MTIMDTALCVMPHGWDASGTPKPVLAYTGLLCKGHRHRLDDVSLEIELLIFDLLRCREAGSTPEQPGGRKEHRKIDDAPPVPVNLDWVVLMDLRTGSTLLVSDNPVSIPRILDAFLQRVPFDADLPTVARRRQVLGRLEVLRARHDWIANQTWVDEYSDALVGIRDQLRQAVRDHEHRPIGTCDTPDRNGVYCRGTLLCENGTGIVRCTACRSVWATPQELARLSVRLG